MLPVSGLLGLVVEPLFWIVLWKLSVITGMDVELELLVMTVDPSSETVG